MASLKVQLKSVAKGLADLSAKVDKLLKEVEKAKPAAAPAKKTKGRAVKKAPATAAKKAAGKETVLDKVYDIVRRSRNGVSIAKLKEKTQLESRQLSNALYKLTKKGKVKTKSRGVYIKA